MGFPYYAPLQPWVIDIMKEREDNLHLAAFRNPYAVLTSGALVVKGGKNTTSSDEEQRKTEIVNILKDPKGYNGCILSNNVNNIDLSYSKNETIVGIDFDGKLIKVDGESGRKISTPIIESIDIDTDGANNTLKTARVSVRCFSLKQFEMFELFYMKPGMNVLVEWGDSSLLMRNMVQKLHPNAPQSEKKNLNTFRDGKIIPADEEYTRPEEALVYKNQSYSDFCDKFSEYYRSDTSAIAKYLLKIEKSRGTYDMVAGKVLDYSFSIDKDGTYLCNLEVSQGNQVSLAIPHSSRSNLSNKGTQAKQPDTEFTEKEQIKAQIASDFNLELSKFKTLLANHPEKNGDWADDWFNFVKINKESKDAVASSDAYISFRFILCVLLNYVLDSEENLDVNFFKLELQDWETKDGKKIHCIPVTSNVYMLSSNQNIIYPRKNIPRLICPTQTQLKNGAKNEIDITSESTLDCTIGKSIKYDFHVSEKLVLPSYNRPEIDVSDAVNPDERLGNALNIFVKYETVVKAWKSTYSRIDFLEKILEIINNSSYGLFMLTYGLQFQNSKPTVIDFKIAPDSVYKQNQKIETYRFKPTTIKSIVKEFSFNFEMSNLVAGRTIFNSGKFLASLKQNEIKEDYKELELPAAAYKAVDNSTFGNADGWYSINNVELKRITANINKAAQDQKNKISEAPPNDETTKQPEQLDEVIKSKSIKFLIDEKPGGKLQTLIYEDSTLIQNKITKSQKTKGKNKTTPSPIQVSITIDGFSGFTPGQYFEIDGIPEIYNKTGVFQITNTKHTVSRDGWNTIIEANWKAQKKD